MKTNVLVLAILTLMMTSCKSDQKKEGDTTKEEQVATSENGENNFDNQITEKYWKLVALNGKEVVFTEGQRKEAHFIMRKEGNKVSGNAGCNNLMGSYELLEGDKIRFSKMATTMMYCEGVENEQEFLKVFETMDHYDLNGDTLLFKNENNEILAKFEAVYF